MFLTNTNQYLFNNLEIHLNQIKFNFISNQVNFVLPKKSRSK